jgi:hypothetical protein
MAVVIQQVNQDVQRLWPKWNLLVAPTKNSAVNIQRESAKRVLAG